MNAPIKLTAAQRIDVLDELRLTYGHSGDVEGLLNDVLAALRDFASPAARPSEPPKALEPVGDDTERMNWLDNNIFHVEPDEWTAKHSPHLNTWRIFAPKGVQGSARSIIDAARSTKGLT